MERKQGKHLSAEEKLRVVEEGRQAGATISGVCLYSAAKFIKYLCHRPEVLIFFLLSKFLGHEKVVWLSL